MDIKIYPGTLKGEIQAPPSKSMAHRALICAALSDGTSHIKGISGSKDMEATMGCMQALGTVMHRIEGENGIDDVVSIGIPMVRGAACSGCAGCGSGGCGSSSGAPAEAPVPVLDCIESGSTLRFVLPIAAALGTECQFTGRGKLPERPMTPLADEMKKHGIEFSPEGRDSLPFTIKGQLTSGVYEIPGNISSQYISGLIFALPMLVGDSEIRVIGDLESASYIDLTLQMVRDFGVEIEKTEWGFKIPGGQKYKGGEIEVEGDYSNAAFWMVADAIGSVLQLSGLREDSAQGDRKAADILAGRRINYTDIDCRDIPDIVPILSVAAAQAPQTTRFYDAGRLRIKESDRLSAMVDCLTRLGAKVEEKEDELIVHPSVLKGGCEVDGYNDHRIVMSMAIAGLICEEPIIIRGAEAVTKSYPNFFEEYRRLGGRADVITDR
ncbi:MAG: 3-phosphoshikimate 1-carboxyvinyltransferase [Firmicutes bacterium]|nr:3-phosphoshikimate 1-carboxyvinyltransferase [Bacillota bacterium]